jgi:glutamate synthase (NADPH/NADH) small chain
MADPKGFLTFKRELPSSREVNVRLSDYKEIYDEFPVEKTKQQAARCMDCGVPFCHSGCPLGNVIPEFNDAVYREEWQEAFQILSETNNFPEFTGRICPAPCEAACVLGINQPAVAIEHIEKTIVEMAFEKGFLRPKAPTFRTGKKVAVIGSGPAGLSAAAELNKYGHSVTVFERKDRIGGLLRYGIPDFKLEKWVLERRIGLMEAEGIRFKTNVNVGVDLSVDQLKNDFDAVVLTGGSTIPRDLPIPGREGKGIYPAMQFLEQSNRRVAGDFIPEVESIRATGKHVVVIGGGDTGADCVGTSNRHKAKSVTQLEVLVKPSLTRTPDSWPNWPLILRTSSSHEEGCEREWSVLTESFEVNEKGEVSAIHLIDVEWAFIPAENRYGFSKIAGTERIIPCDLALLAIGFVHPQHDGLLQQLGVALDERGNVKASNFKTSVDGVFAAGDVRRGQSLVVWAIAEGRDAAKEVHVFLDSES